MKRNKQYLVPVGERILEWAKNQGLRVWWGRSKTNGSFYPMFDYHGQRYFTIGLWSNGMAEMQFQYISTRLPYQDDQRMKQLIKDFGAIFNTTFSDDAGKRRPSVPLDILLDEAKMLQLQQLLGRMIVEHKIAADESASASVKLSTEAGALIEQA